MMRLEGLIPKKISDELQEDWLKCDEILEPEITPEAKKDAIDNVFIEMSLPIERRSPFWQLSTEKFLWLMGLNLDDLPDFFHGNTYHVLKNYYVQIRNGKPHNLCEFCYISESKFYKPYSNNVWQELGITYTKTRTHDVVRNGQVLVEDVLWNAENWCNRCITQPLFRVLDSKEDCMWETPFHNRKRTYRCYESDYSTDDDSDADDYVEMKFIKGNTVPDEEYKRIKLMRDYLQMN